MDAKKLPAIEVRDLRKSYRSVRRQRGLSGALRSLWKREYTSTEAVRGISFDVAEGELVGFLGPNGAGKTTTLKMISGLLYPDGGFISCLGATPQQRRHDFLRRITFVMGNRSQLWWEVPIRESFELNREIYELDANFYRDSLNELLDLLQLRDLLTIPAKKLSLGQRMKAELVAALLHRPKLLLLDEPTLGLDVVMQQKIRRFLLEYNRRRGATMLLTSHNMEDIAELCQRVIIIDQGKLLYDGSLRQLVARYAPEKTILLEFVQEPEDQALRQYGLKPVNGSATLCVRKVARDEVSSFAAAVLAKSGSGLPQIRDLTIEETPVEDVIRRIFEFSGQVVK
ncbi:MAG: ATP-binding cassette domain-containing protein [Elusimicrobia bacterium]|nr:ATP-binding cassette domain-containing protein [Elusimicrobiota bacterium]